MIKKFVLGLFLILCFVDSSFSANVTDNGGGNKGYILVNTGTGQGHQGTWTDPSFLKGEKGDIGATGATGTQGIQGVAGINGSDGKNGVNGQDGKDVDPTLVTKFQNDINCNSNAINEMNNRVNDLEKTQTIISGEIRLYDGKKITVSTFIDYTTTRQMVEKAGVKIVYKMGKSTEEKELEKVNARLNKLEEKREAQVSEQNIEIYKTENGIEIKEKF